MSNWATPADVTTRWVGAGAPTNTAQVQAILDDAEQVILAEYPRIQERIDAETLAVETVRLVVVRMATRILRNPDGATYLAQTTGPFGMTRNLGENVDLFLTPQERALLAPTGRGRAFEIDLGANAVSPSSTSEVWRDA